MDNNLTESDEEKVKSTEIHKIIFYDDNDKVICELYGNPSHPQFSDLDETIKNSIKKTLYRTLYEMVNSIEY